MSADIPQLNLSQEQREALAREDGEERMRTACWEEVRKVCAAYGITEHLFQELKRAVLEEASP